MTKNKRPRRTAGSRFLLELDLGWLTAKADASLPPLPPRLLHVVLVLALPIYASTLPPEVLEHIFSVTSTSP